MQRQAFLTRQLGVSLVEVMITVAIAAVTVGAVLPDFSRMQQRHRLDGVAGQLESEMQFARSMAVADGRAVRFGFRAVAGQSCYVIHTGGPGACQCEGETAVCTGAAAAIRSAGFNDSEGMRVTSNSASFMFDPVKGTVSPTATVTLANAKGDVVRLVVNVMGRVRACSPSGLTGHKPC